MDSTSKYEEDAAADFGLDWMILKDDTIVKEEMGGPKKAKAESQEPNTMEATGVNKNAQPVQAATEIAPPPEEGGEPNWKGKCWNKKG